MRRIEVRRSRWGGLLAMLIVALATSLSACGGGDSTPVASPAPAAIGADGGKVEVPGVATVVVPPGALHAQTTIRVAQDSSAAPPVPAWFTPAGPMVAITPHGASFPEPVTVRLPAPNVTLKDTERLLLAKAQPGGEWEVFSDTVLKDGQLEIQVNSFSTLVPVVVNFTVSTYATLQAPFAMSPITLECDGAPCANPERLRPMTVTATTSANGGYFPANCANPRLDMFYGGPVGSPFGTIVFGIDASATTVLRRSFPLPTTFPTLLGFPSYLYVTVRLSCTDPTTNARSMLLWPSSTLMTDPARFIAGIPVVREFPSTVVAAAGESPVLRAVFQAGATSSSDSTPPNYSAPTPGDEAEVSVYRLPPGGAAWLDFLTFRQTQANPRPYGGPDWQYWSLDVPIGVLTPADNGVSYMLMTCYRHGCRTGSIARVTVVQAQAPTFTTQPRSVLIQPGQTASFSAQVNGTPAPSLRWQTRSINGNGNWTDVSANGNSANYTTPLVSLADNGIQYRLVAANSAGSVASDIVSVSINPALLPPVITTSPASLSVVRGSEALFAVNATGTEALSYQWFKGGAAITGANAPQLKIGNVADADAGSYSVEVSNPAGRVTSASAQLTVTGAVPAAVAPAIVTQPAAVAVTEGNVATFAVGVTGTGPMSFQWRKNGVDIASANAAAYTLPAVAIADGGNYSVRVFNGAGDVVSQPATLAVAQAVGAPPAQPVAFATQPGSVVVAPGMSATLAVTVSGSGPLSYQWFHNGLAVPGQTSAVYSIGAASALDAGSYVVQVTNSAGSTGSAAGQVLLLGAPAITVQPAAQSASEGSNATFSVAATGDALRYQWLRNSVAIAGADTGNYTTPALTVADGGAVYSVIVYNGAGLVFSSGAVLSVTSTGNPTQAGMSIYAGHLSAGGGGNSGDGVGTGARFDYPEGLSADSAGNLYVANSNGGRVSRIDASAGVTTLALEPGVSQLGLSPGGGDLWAAATSYCGLARISPPRTAGSLVTPVNVIGCPGSETRGAAVDNNGVLYLALRDAHSVMRLTLSAQSGSMDATLFAGAANTYTGAGSQDGSGSSARFNAPRGIAFGPDGNLYVADTGNHTIRRITPQGTVSTFVGLAGQAGSVDGTTSAARLDSPIAIAFDPAGNLVVLDRGPESALHARVRRITSAGEVTTLFDAHAESLALAQPGQESFATNIKGLAVLDARRIALSAGNAILVRTLP